MGLPDHYRTLGLSEYASAEEIKRAFRRQARECHPDRRRGDHDAEARFKEISKAHAVLSDPAQRAEYDRLRRDPLATPREPGPSPSGSAEKRSAPARAGAAVASFLSGLFGPGGPQRHRGRGRDLTATIRIPFAIAAGGGQQALTIRRETRCERCQGTAAEPDTPVATCATCRGQGEVLLDQGTFGISRVCHHCRGRGTIPRTACRRCHGAGVLTEERTISVRIPPGIESGTRLRISGAGEPGTDSQPGGDLIVSVQVNKHSDWKRVGEDIHSELTVDLSQAVLGDTVGVETLTGPVRLRIPAGTQPETVLRLRGHGISRSDGRGDHFVRVHVEIPQALAEDAERKFKTFARTAGLRRRAD